MASVQECLLSNLLSTVHPDNQTPVTFDRGSKTIDHTLLRKPKVQGGDPGSRRTSLLPLHTRWSFSPIPSLGDYVVLTIHVYIYTNATHQTGQCQTRTVTTVDSCILISFRSPQVDFPLSISFVSFLNKIFTVHQSMSKRRIKISNDDKLCCIRQYWWVQQNGYTHIILDY
jgi:hypothetical protein